MKNFLTDVPDVPESHGSRGLALLGRSQYAAHHAPQKFMICRILVMKSLSSLAAAVTAGPRVEIYTELVCRGYTPLRVQTPTLLSSPPVATTAPSVILSNAVSPTQAHFPHDEQAYTTVYTTGLYMTAAQPLGGCASHPHIQAEIAKLGAGLWFGYHIHVFTDCGPTHSHRNHWRHLVVPHHRLVGWSAYSFPY
jgi:hypothetical protein